MNFIYRSLSGQQEQTTSPETPLASSVRNGSLEISSLIQQHRLQESQEEPEQNGLFSAASAPTPSAGGGGFLDLSLQTQAFGPIPTGLGVSEKGDLIRVNTSALEGVIDCGEYEV